MITVQHPVVISHAVCVHDKRSQKIGDAGAPSPWMGALLTPGKHTLS